MTAAGSGRRRVLGGALGVLAAPAVHAQGTAGWPGDRVTIVTSLPAGSTVNLTTRIYADQLAQAWNRPVVIDNRGGGNGVLACQMVARVRPDGLTLLATSAMTHAANPALYTRPPYNAVEDFDAVARYDQPPSSGPGGSLVGHRSGPAPVSGPGSTQALGLIQLCWRMPSGSSFPGLSAAAPRCSGTSILQCVAWRRPGTGTTRRSSTRPAAAH